jgi:hypothetical protein
VQRERLAQNAEKHDDQAWEAVRQGRDDLARRALEKKQRKRDQVAEIDDQIASLEQTQRDLEEQKDDIAENVTEILTDTVGDVVAQESKTESKEMVDRIIGRLDEQATDIGSDGREDDSFWEKVERNTGIRRTKESVELVDGTTGTEDLVNFVQFLFDRGHLTIDDLPIESGNVRYILNTENAHQDGSEMTLPKEVVNGVYLETHNNTEGKKRRIVMLGERFGEQV